MVDYSPFSEAAIEDPHSLYRQLRGKAPVYYLKEYDAWALACFEDVWQASMDAESYSATGGSSGDQLLSKTMPAVPMLNAMDPPSHTRLRALMRPFFMPKRLRELEPTIRKLIDEHMDALAEAERLDAVSHVGEILAGQVACLVSGFPLEDVDPLVGWIRRYFERDPESRGITPDGLAAFGEMVAYLAGMARGRRARGSDEADPLDALLGFEEEGKALDDDAIALHLALLVLGGFETFPKVFAAALHRLFEHPDQRASLIADPSRIPHAWQEVLRYDMPTQFLGRTVAREVQVRDQTLRPGQPVIFLYASANRDEAEFDNPDVFDIERRAPRILSFGHGQHSCLGQHVARMEGQLSLAALLARFPDYELDLSDAERYQSEFIQGFSRLPLQVRA